MSNPEGSTNTNAVVFHIDGLGLDKKGEDMKGEADHTADTAPNSNDVEVPLKQVDNTASASADGVPKLKVTSSVLPLASRDVILDSSLSHRDLNPTVLDLLKTTPRLIVAVGIGAMGGFLFGSDTGVIGSVQSFTGYNRMMGFPDGGQTEATNAGNLDLAGSISDKNSWVTSSLTLACAFTALFAGPTSDFLGRKYAVLFGAFVVTVGGIIQAASNGYSMMVAGRVVSGLAIGTLSTIVPIYVSEVAPKSLRGVCGVFWQMCITWGIMVADGVNLGFGGQYGTSGSIDGWRWALGIQAAFSISLSLLVFLIPESPRYLVQAGKSEQARAVLFKLRPAIVVGKHATTGEPVTAVDLEVADIEEEVAFYRTHETGTYLDLLKPDMWLRTSIGICLQFFQQLTGVNAIFYYGPLILGLIGLPPLSSALYIAIVNVGSTFIPIFLMDKLGRRTFLLWGAAGMAISNFIVTGLFFGSGYNKDTANMPRSYANGILAFVCIFIFHFAIAWGPIPWLYPTEIFPIRVRGKGVAIATMADWMANFMISKTVSDMLLPNHFTPGGTFAFFASFATLAGIWTFFIIRETSGVVLERADLLFTTPSWASLKKYITLNVRYSLTFNKEEAEKIKMTPVYTREGEAAAVANLDLVDLKNANASILAAAEAQP